jgi:hypothetical protein
MRKEGKGRGGERGKRQGGGGKDGVGSFQFPFSYRASVFIRPCCNRVITVLKVLALGVLF